MNQQQSDMAIAFIENNRHAIVKITIQCGKQAEIVQEYHSPKRVPWFKYVLGFLQLCFIMIAGCGGWLMLPQSPLDFFIKVGNSLLIFVPAFIWWYSKIKKWML